MFFLECFNHAWRVPFVSSPPGGPGVFLVTPGGSLFFKPGGVHFFLFTRLGVPVLFLLHSCPWAGVFVVLNSRLGSLFFVF